MVSKEAMVPWWERTEGRLCSGNPSCRTRKSQKVGSNVTVPRCADAKATAGTSLQQATSRWTCLKTVPPHQESVDPLISWTGLLGEALGEREGSRELGAVKRGEARVEMREE